MKYELTVAIDAFKTFGQPLQDFQKKKKKRIKNIQLGNQLASSYIYGTFAYGIKIF